MRGLMCSVILSLLSFSAMRAADAPVIACPPGQPTMLVGTGPARSGILLHWAGQVIGGGVIRADGTWQVPVQPAVDAPSGDYPVNVTQRDSGQVLGAWTCQVVNATLPTPGQRRPDRAPAAATATATATPAVPSATATAPVAAPPVPTATATAQPSATTLPTATATDVPPAAAAPPPAVACALVCIVASDVTTADAPGYLVIQNDGSTAADLAGWTLRAGDATLPLTATLMPNDVLMVYSMDGDDEPGTVYWPAAPFAAGDPITLTDAAGVVQQQWTLGTSAASMDDGEVQP